MISSLILLIVLWAIALMSALAMAAAVSFRGFAGVAAVGHDRVQGDALLEMPNSFTHSSAGNDSGELVMKPVSDILVSTVGHYEERLSGQDSQVVAFRPRATPAE